MQANHSIRAILEGGTCVKPASVFDPMTARMAADAGFELAVLGGSVAGLAVLGAPDHALLTLDELAGLCRRICRRSPLPLLVDADHGYGNALNVMRCIEELETAGVSAISLEDTVLPYPFGHQEPQLLSVAEAKGKVAAALSARRNPDFVIFGRTIVRPGFSADLLERTRAFADAGVDGIFLTGARRVSDVTAVREATGLPIVLGAARGELAEVDDLGMLGVRICLTGHGALPAALAAVWEFYRKDRGSGPLSPSPADLMDRYSESRRYDDLIDTYLK
ncbi:Oxaloacetate decarboxylase [Rhizobium sp. CF080]|uniref:isocitrate lyase/PEP mutase family protein n=1 Tax=Rhizobium sp. (strain CF080) TaxID=1144310 RepID=UPI000271811E|nr:isocitrate lyase/PEP mutase family protein [Rhizobium sp. CF080]EUB98139.1 Oxaloacetate decarboxylase [Rhizobium sp. CF080]